MRLFFGEQKRGRWKRGEVWDVNRASIFRMATVGNGWVRQLCWVWHCSSATWVDFYFRISSEKSNIFECVHMKLKGTACYIGPILRLRTKFFDWLYEVFSSFFMETLSQLQPLRHGNVVNNLWIWLCSREIMWPLLASMASSETSLLRGKSKSPGPAAFLSPFHMGATYILYGSPSCSELLVFQWADNIYFAETYTSFCRLPYFTALFRSCLFFWEWIFQSGPWKNSLNCVCSFLSRSLWLPADLVSRYER